MNKQTTPEVPAKPKKHAGGRPSKYNPDEIEKLNALMSVGASLIEVAAALDVTRETLYDWSNPKSPRFKKEFSNTLKKARVKSEAWWEEQGRVNLNNKEFSPVLWYMNMKNRFGWRDKQEVDIMPANTVSFVNEVPKPQPITKETILPDDNTDTATPTD